MKNEEIFANVFGYEGVKKELLGIRDWFLDKELVENPNIRLPKGILLHGEPGCGKTLLIRDYSKSFGYKVFVVNGDSQNVLGEITNAFKEARKEKMAIIVIDELDLLVKHDPIMVRALQSELDGYDNSGNVLLLSSTNFLYEIPNPLLRSGRFDIVMEISRPDFEARKKLYKSELNKLGVNLSAHDVEEISRNTTRLICSDIASICNEAYLMKGDKLTVNDLEEAWRRVVRNQYEEFEPKKRTMRVAIHEAGHIMMVRRYKSDFAFFSASFNGEGGETTYNQVNEEENTISKKKELVQIALSGFLAESIVLGQRDLGSEYDVDMAWGLARSMIEQCCVNSISSYVSISRDYHQRSDSPVQRRINEKQIQRLLDKMMKDANRYLKKNKEELVSIANALFAKGRLSYLDLA